MTDIKFLKDRIIIDGHADTKEQCETITLLCDNLAKSKDFKTVRYEKGYAEFEKVGQAGELKFVSAPTEDVDITLVWDSGITSVTGVPNETGGSYTWTTSNTAKTVTAIFGDYETITYTPVLKDGYVIDTVTTNNDGSASADTINIADNKKSFTVSLMYPHQYATITITTKQTSSSGETWVFNETPQLPFSPKTQTFITNFTSNGGSYGRIDINNPAPDGKEAIYYNATPVLDSALSWIDEGYRTIILEQSATGDLLAMLTKAAVKQTAISKQQIDLSTLSGWANLSNGEHSITVKVKASGYADSAASNAVSVTVTKAASVQYYGTATPLSQARDSMGATTVGNYALFGGGNYNGYKNVVDAYDASLTRTIPTPLSVARSFAAATTVGNYALFGGGGSNDTTFATVDAYNASLTRSIPTPFEKARTHVAATTVGNYALFCGGNLNLNNRTDEMDAYDTSLTKAILAPYSNEITNLAATTIGNYALFGGGRYNGYTDIVNAYDASLTRTLPTVLSVGRESLSAATVGNYALFGGGWNLNNSSNVVDAYDASLTRTTPTALSAARRYITTTTVGGFALFAGGNYGEGSTVDAYDVNLTRTLPTPLPNADYWFGGATIGNYALFAGGYSNDDEVNVYTVA